jgi:hypothetical protein
MGGPYFLDGGRAPGLGLRRFDASHSVQSDQNIDASWRP